MPLSGKPPDGKGRGRLIRKPEDEQIDPQGRFMVTTAPGQSRQGLFLWAGLEGVQVRVDEAQVQLLEKV